MNRKTRKFSQITFLLLLSFLELVFFTACQTTDFQEPQEFNFENNACVYEIPFGKIYISRINLEESSLQIITKIDTENLFSLEDFCKETDSNYAINTTPFFYNENHQIELLGCCKINNKVISKPIEKYSALGFYFSDNGKVTAKIIKNQTDQSIEEFPFVVGGYFTILENSNILPYKNIKRSRIACGLTSDGKTLYLLCVTSTLNSDKSGLSYPECAQILKSLGCTDAIEFDGGHSTALKTPQLGLVTSKNPRKIPAALGFYINNLE